MNATLEAPTLPGQNIRPMSRFLYLLYVEAVKLLRIPMFTIFGILFPTLLFAMFGLPNAGDTFQGISAGAFMMASFGAYTVLNVGLFTFGASIAAERGLGWNKILRVTPLDPPTYFLARIAVALVFGAIAIAILFTFGALVGRIQLPILVWMELAGLLLLGLIPFAALGLFVGYVAGPNSAGVIVNLVALPLSFASGIFVPVQRLPLVVQEVAPYLPLYHVGQLGWTLVKAGDDRGMAYHLAWLAISTLVFLAMAARAYRRDESANFG